MATITVFLGSERNGRQGEKVARLIVDELKRREHEVHLIDPLEHHELAHLKLPFHYNKEPSADMRKVHEWLLGSDGFIIVSPEYNHSFSGVVKDMLDNFMPEYEKKPFGIATYSSNFTGGVRANEALRIVVSELKGISTPMPFMVPFVEQVFDAHGKPADKAYNERLARFLDDFEWYVDALRSAREQHAEGATRASGTISA